MLSAAATLELWEAAQALPPIERALVLAGGDEVADLPLGRRDARLLELYAALAGQTLDATGTCPACGEAAEFSVDVADLLAHAAAEARAVEPVDVDGLVVEWRPPTSRDLAAAAAAAGAAEAERVLLGRCVTSDSVLSDSARVAVSEAMSAADPLAEVLVDVTCPACGSVFVSDVDVGEFVWAELRVRALGLLRDVDVLARAYGWTEAEAFALGERRRQAYLELAEATR